MIEPSQHFGGGVAEILASFLPLLQDLGIDADWQVIEASPEFFDVTKNMHNAMQGMYIPWNTGMADLWRQTNQQNADLIADAAELRVKESDRIRATVDGLSRLGARIAPMGPG